ncbi:hypothetical protein L2E82_40182 [Cichorium intybus]|uniref:Uncharacterized protein n=1 Tax=Cichorium intybus TaxID=13427 RepID=A0ACB9AJS3_CICIN|nr:hypothetical protein L2E82_40182 [Cichorium intybus]
MPTLSLPLFSIAWNRGFTDQHPSRPPRFFLWVKFLAICFSDCSCNQSTSPPLLPIHRNRLHSDRLSFSDLIPPASTGSVTTGDHLILRFSFRLLHLLRSDTTSSVFSDPRPEYVTPVLMSNTRRR